MLQPTNVRLGVCSYCQSSGIELVNGKLSSHRTLLLIGVWCEGAGSTPEATYTLIPTSRETVLTHWHEDN